MHTLSSRVLLLDNRLRVVEGHIVAQHKQQQQQQQQQQDEKEDGWRHTE
jgi:hypothetical protein